MAVIVFFSVSYIQGGLTMKEASPVRLQVGERAEFVFTVTNTGDLNGLDLKELTVEFIDDKWLVRTVNASIDHEVLNEGDSAAIKITLEGAKAGVNDDARVRLTYPGGGKEFRVKLTVDKDPNSNLTFKLSSLSPVELLAFNKRCSGS